MGGRDHADIDLNRRGAADAIELAVLQYAQQAGLQVRRHVADFIQKQRAAVGLLEAALALGSSAGKRAALVAEELGLQQILGDGCGVDGDEGFLRTRRGLVQRAGDQLLTGTRFTSDQHRDVAGGQATDSAEHLLHCRGFANDGGGRRVLRLGKCGARAGSAAHQAGSGIQIEGLGQVLKSPALVAGDCGVQVRVGGHDDHRQLRPARAHAVEQRKAIDAGHSDVAYQHVGPVFVQLVEHLHRALKHPHLHAFAAQGFLQHPADAGVVIDDPNLDGSSCGGRRTHGVGRSNGR